MMTIGKAIAPACAPISRSSCQSRRGRFRPGRRVHAWFRGGAWLGVWLGLASPLAALNPDRRADSYSIQRWFMEQGLPSSKIRAVTQTRDGYLWLATAQGIARFDGRDFTVFNGATNPELRGGSFYAAQEAPDGSLWFGGDNGLFRWRNGSFEVFTTAQGPAHDLVRVLALTRDGAVVACTPTGFSIMRDGHLTTPGGVWKEVDGATRSFLERSDGRILLGTTRGLWQISGEHIEQLSGTADLPGNSFTSLCETPDGSVWIGYSGGVRRLRPDGKKEDYGAAEGLIDPRILALQPDHDGNMWIATYSNGFYRLTRGRIQAVTFPDQPGSIPVQKLFEDREGALWLAASTGLFRVRDNMSSMIDRGAGDEALTSAYSVLEARDGTWWIGLWGGGVYRYDQKEAVHLAVPPSLGLNQVLSLAEEPAGTLWIGTNSGLYRHRDGVTTNLFQLDQAAAWEKQLAQRPETILPGIARPHVNSIAADGDGGLWVATDGALYRGRDGSFRTFTTADGLPGNIIKSVIRARHGDIWITAPPEGVACLHEGRWTRYLCGQAISAIFPRAVYEDDAGTIWVTTEGGGLNRFQDGRWRTFTTHDGLADDFISAIAEDKLGNFWLAFPRGVMRVPRTEFADVDAGRRATLRLRVFDKSDGLPAAETNQKGSPNAWLARDGRLLLATDGGVAVIEPDNLRTNSLVPPMHLERFAVNGTDADLSRPVSVPPGGNYVQIHYTATSLLAPEKVRFKIRLAPLDRDWVDNGGRREVRYDRLPPGGYTFRAIACNNDGVWNEEGVTLAFIVRPFFYETTWFIGLVVAAGVGGIFGFYGVRARRARRQLAVMGKLVDERTRQLQAEVDERKRTATALQSSETFLHSLVENVPVHIFRKDRAGRFTFANKLFCERFGRSPDQIVGTTVFDFLPAAEAEKAQRVDEEIMASGEVSEVTDEPITANGKPAFIHLIKVPVFDAARQCVGLQGMFLDVTERKRAEAELGKLHEQLLKTSRQAGMAEIATGVLHNVGNVLNSVNVSATLVTQQVRHSKGANVAKLAAMFAEHQADLAAFLTTDPRGQMIPGFLGTLTESLAAEQKTLIAELEHLRKNVEHINAIVTMQQSYANTSGFIETIPLADLVEEALRMNASSLARHDVELVRDFKIRPVISTDRHKIMQILINLVRNAKFACDEAGRPGKRITVRITGAAQWVRVSVNDNGVGISAENLTRIFAHGFTTRIDGHGFGLHSGALAARELGGSLTVQSDGPGHGATFILELPLKPDTPAHENSVR